MKSRKCIPLILASASPQRRTLLKKAGFKFSVEKSGYRENLELRLSPMALAKYLSLGKAQTVAKRHTDGVVIGADTVVVRRGRVFGKPRGKADAKKMLAALSGKTHEIITGFSFVDAATGRYTTHAVVTKVRFKSLTSSQIDSYVATGEGQKAAGGYAYQKKGRALVLSVAGSEDNIIGLPIHELSKKLRLFLKK